SDRTSRCFMIAGSDTGKGRASSLTEIVSRSSSWASSARRVASESAAKVRSSAVSLYLTMWLSLLLLACKCQPAMALTLLQEQLEGIVDTGSGAFYGPPGA